jgi:hypothetical protein
MIEKMVLYPSEEEVNTIIAKNRLSQFAMEVIDWTDISEKIIEIVQEEIGTKFGLKEEEEEGKPDRHWEYANVKKVVDSIQEAILDPLNDELNQKLALVLTQP